MIYLNYTSTIKLINYHARLDKKNNVEKLIHNKYATGNNQSEKSSSTKLKLIYARLITYFGNFVFGILLI